MSSVESVTTWVEALRAGDQAAAERLWARYYPRLVGLARKKLQGSRRRTADEEDVALSAFDSFCGGLRAGRFPRLEDRDNLWALLVLITSRKAIDLRQKEKRLKNGGGRVGGESVLDAVLGDEEGAAGINQVVGAEPTPELAAQVAEQLQRLLAQLPSDELRQVALWKMEGYTNGEIAARLPCARATVERRLKLIRSLWGGPPGTEPPMGSFPRGGEGQFRNPRITPSEAYWSPGTGGGIMSDSLLLSVQLRLEEVCARFEAAGPAGPPPSLAERAAVLGRETGLVVEAVPLQGALRPGFAQETARAAAGVTVVGDDWLMEQDFGRPASELVESAGCPLLVLRAAE
jgi:DNA-directed RNA polymerase specialized sigma24 family protein